MAVTSIRDRYRSAQRLQVPALSEKLYGVAEFGLQAPGFEAHRARPVRTAGGEEG